LQLLDLPDNVFDNLQQVPPPQQQQLLQQTQQQQQHEHQPQLTSSATAQVQGRGAVRLVNCSHNHLQRLPASVSSLTSLTTLCLSHNALKDEGMQWGLLAEACGGSLTFLELDANELTVRTFTHVPP